MFVKFQRDLMTARHHVISSIQLKHTIVCYFGKSLVKPLQPLKFVSMAIINMWEQIYRVIVQSFAGQVVSDELLQAGYCLTTSTTTLTFDVFLLSCRCSRTSVYANTSTGIPAVTCCGGS